MLISIKIINLLVMKANELMIGDWVLVKPSMMLIKVAAAEKYIYNLFYGDHKVYWSEKIEYSVKQLLLII